MAGRLGGKVAMVTGAGSGIGRAAATLFAREGAAVAVVDLAGQAAADTTAAIAAEGGRAMAVTADVSDRGQVDAAFGLVAAELGPPDVLYNNAGVNSASSVLDATDDDWDRCFAVNARGTFPVLQRGRPADGGRRTRVDHQPGIGGGAGRDSQLRRLLRGQGRRGRADPVHVRRPGPARHPGQRDLPRHRVHPADGTAAARPRGRRRGGRASALTVARYPIGRLGTPGGGRPGSAVPLASDEASFLTGSVITADGGMTSQ